MLRTPKSEAFQSSPILAGFTIRISVPRLKKRPFNGFLWKFTLQEPSQLLCVFGLTSGGFMV